VPFQLVRACLRRQANLFDDAFLSSGPTVGPSFGLNSWNGTSGVGRCAALAEEECLVVDSFAVSRSDDSAKLGGAWLRAHGPLRSHPKHGLSSFPATRIEPPAGVLAGGPWRDRHCCLPRRRSLRFARRLALRHRCGLRRLIVWIRSIVRRTVVGARCA